MNMIRFSDIKFSKCLRGYDITEVDALLQDIIDKYNSLLDESNQLKKEIQTHRKREEVIQLTLLTAQEAARNLKQEAEEKAKEIKSDAEKFALSLIGEAEKEVNLYRDSIQTHFYNYEQDLTLVLEDFYALSRKHINNLEYEFMQKIKDKILCFDKKLSEFTISKDLINKIKGKDIMELKDQWQRKEYSLILGQSVTCDILDANQEVLVSSGTVVTPELIESLIKKGLYGQLISSIDYREDTSGGQ